MNRNTAIAVVVSCVLLAGCARHAGTTGQGASPVRSRETSAGIPFPSLTRLGVKQAQAVGMVVFRREQHGYFALADIVPGEAPDPSAKLISILVQPDGSRRGNDLVPLVGAYCAFSGKLRDQSPTSSPTPELIVESYRILSVP